MTANEANDSSVAIDLKVNAREPTGCLGFTSIYEPGKVRSCRESGCGACANCWQGYEEMRWSLSLIGMKQPLKCLLSISPKLGYVARFSVSQILCLIAFIVVQVILMREAFDVDTGDDALDRYEVGLLCGWAANQNFAVVFVLAQRNTLMNLIFGIPMERSIQYHRLVAYVSIGWSYLHFLLIILYWADADELETKIEEEHSLTGLIMIGCLTLILLSTLNWVRRNHFEFFIKTHWILFCVFLWASWKHDDLFSTATFLIALIFWVADLLWRTALIFLWGKPGVIKNLEVMPGGVVKVTWDRKDMKYEGGQYAFICIPALDMTQWHPFSISSGPDDGVNTFHIRALGDFTEKLAMLAKQRVTDWTRLQAYIEGPYGKPEVPVHRYKSLLLVSGGIGITPMQSIWSELMSLIAAGSKFEEIHFVWYCRNPDMCDEFDRVHWAATNRAFGAPAQFAHIVKVRDTTLKTTYVFTRQAPPNAQERFGPGFVSGRAKVTKFIDEMKTDCKAVLACGPARMLADVKNHCAMNGIACHTEVFTF